MRKEGWTRSYALSVLRSRFEAEERHQEVAYVDDLIRKEAEEQEEEQELVPIATTTNTVEEEEITTTKEPAVTTTTTSSKPSKVTQQKGLQETNLQSPFPRNWINKLFKLIKK